MRKIKETPFVQYCKEPIAKGNINSKLSKIK